MTNRISQRYDSTLRVFFARRQAVFLQLVAGVCVGPGEAARAYCDLADHTWAPPKMTMTSNLQDHVQKFSRSNVIPQSVKIMILQAIISDEL